MRPSRRTTIVPYMGSINEPSSSLRRSGHDRMDVRGIRRVIFTGRVHVSLPTSAEQRDRRRSGSPMLIAGPVAHRSSAAEPRSAWRSKLRLNVASSAACRSDESGYPAFRVRVRAAGLSSFVMFTSGLSNSRSFCSVITGARAEAGVALPQQTASGSGRSVATAHRPGRSTP